MRIPKHIDAPRELATPYRELLCWKCNKPSQSHKDICQACFDSVMESIPVLSGKKKRTAKERKEAK